MLGKKKFHEIKLVDSTIKDTVRKLLLKVPQGVDYAAGDTVVITESVDGFKYFLTRISEVLFNNDDIYIIIEDSIWREA